MKNINNLKLKINSTIKNALTIIDNGAMRIALVVDNNDVLLGTVTDGDIRRGIIKGLKLEDTIDLIMCKNPTFAYINESKDNMLSKVLQNKHHQIPILDKNNKVIDVKEIEELVKIEKKPNRIILMVGGLGTRLRPLTNNIPKPMLKVGDKPILQIIIEGFAKYGFVNITMCVNYKSEIIENYFKDGSKFGVNIEYTFEKQNMGTAGALSILTSKPKEPFFVMNGDLLTDINYETLLNFHNSKKSEATMCVREYEVQIPYGVVNIENEKITSIKEKPLHTFFVSAGIYVLSPKVLKHVPKDKFYDMPTLFESLINQQQNIISYPIKNYWIDIGKLKDFEKANLDYKANILFKG